MDDFAINKLADKSNLFLLNCRVQLFRTTKTSCTHKKADVNKKDEIYSISSFLFFKKCNKWYNSEYLFAQKVGQKCYNLELSFCDFPEHIGFELKQQLFLTEFFIDIVALL